MKLSRRSFFRLLAAAPVAAKAIASTPAKPLPKPKPVVPSVDGADQCGSSLKTNGWSASVTVLSPGDVIRIESVNRLNPFTDLPIDPLSFIVTEEVKSERDGSAVIPIFPAIIPTSRYRNVSGSPKNRAHVYPWKPRYDPSPLRFPDRAIVPNRPAYFS